MQSKVLPQDNLYHYTIGTRSAYTPHPDRYPSCRIPVSGREFRPIVRLTAVNVRENLKHEKQIMLPTPQRADLFGVPLEELMGFDGEKGGLPRVVKDCIQYLRSTGRHLFSAEHACSIQFPRPSG